MLRGCTVQLAFYTKVLYSEPVQEGSKISLRVKRGRLGSWNPGINAPQESCKETMHRADANV